MQLRGLCQVFYRTPRLQPRSFYVTAKTIFENSCYSKVDYVINQNECVQRAVVRFASLDIGCLAIIDDHHKFVGLFSEGDFIKKVAACGKEAAAIQLHEISTPASNIVIANPDDSIEDCMVKMHAKQVHHLPIIDDKQTLNGLISIKDLYYNMILKNKDLHTKLTNFHLGKGAFFGSE